MALGIGVRYSEHGLRALAVERTGGGITVTAAASGPWPGDIRMFLTDRGFPVDRAAVAAGLGPGDFLSVFLRREDDMDDGDLEEHLRWEIGRKMITDSSAYSTSFSCSGDVGFLFAARREVVEKLSSPEFPVPAVDVEPSALADGCEGAGECGDGPAVLVSVESEGISSIALEDGMPVAVESFSAGLEEWIDRLPGLDFLGDEILDSVAAERFAKYAAGSVSRLSSRLGGAWKPARIVLAGCGVYTGDVAGMTAAKTGVDTVVSNPFGSARVRMQPLGPRFSGLGSAFTVCFGLALRAIEE